MHDATETQAKIALLVWQATIYLLLSGWKEEQQNPSEQLSITCIPPSDYSWKIRYLPLGQSSSPANPLHWFVPLRLLFRQSEQPEFEDGFDDEIKEIVVKFNFRGFTKLNKADFTKLRQEKRVAPTSIFSDSLFLSPTAPCVSISILAMSMVDYRSPTRTLWKGKMVIGKEALFVIMGLKRLNIGGQKLKRLKQTTDYCIQKSLRQEKKTCKRCSSFHNVL
ncbi:hypothetical protein Bca52824_040324 [Brassica carinata]|uniref:Uncharacterized protein n=1 Tax=Brassica carinata TaxID=52824 RepID=A0A8X7UVE4_BRACI|nr:hypothetical protein Bca52824_040324 [Brassica carinata]